MKSDPSYSDAWSSLSAIYLDEDRFHHNPRPNPLDRALEAARRAVALDPTSQFAHEVLALVHFHRRELDAFFPEAESAIALNPNNAGALAALGTRFHLAGDERGIALVRKAMKLDPFLPGSFNLPLGHDHFEKGEYEEALTAVRKIGLPSHFWTQALLAGIFAELGRQTGARSAVEELLRLYPGCTTEKLGDEWRKWNLSEDSIRRRAAALRKAGLPE